jgi:hypothetical protein
LDDVLVGPDVFPEPGLEEVLEDAVDSAEPGDVAVMELTLSSQMFSAIMRSRSSGSWGGAIVTESARAKSELERICMSSFFVSWSAVSMVQVASLPIGV